MIDLATLTTSGYAEMMAVTSTRVGWFATRTNGPLRQLEARGARVDTAGGHTPVMYQWKNLQEPPRIARQRRAASARSPRRRCHATGSST